MIKSDELRLADAPADTPTGTLGADLSGVAWRLPPTPAPRHG